MRAHGVIAAVLFATPPQDVLSLVPLYQSIVITHPLLVTVYLFCALISPLCLPRYDLESIQPEQPQDASFPLPPACQSYHQIILISQNIFCCLGVTLANELLSQLRTINLSTHKVAIISAICHIGIIWPFLSHSGNANEDYVKHKSNNNILVGDSSHQSLTLGGRCPKMVSSNKNLTLKIKRSTNYHALNIMQTVNQESRGAGESF